jgi:uncharacterized membrane protein YcaP (DUF421 family)
MYRHELEAETSPENWEKVKQKIKEDPKITQDKLKQIDESIKICEQTLKLEPYNKEMREKLERLRMLKSIAKQLNP